MYVPTHFAMDEAAARGLMRRNPFALLVSHGPEGLAGTHLPTVVRDEAGALVIEAHLARANPHWRALAAAPGTQVMIVYQGAEAYIRPGWYPSKAEHGKVVPTWNYDSVHVYGRATMIEDGDWLVRHVSEMSDQLEGRYELPWSTADAPESYIPALARGIVGISVAVTRVEGKSKMSQNRPMPDREGVVAGLEVRADGADRAVAEAVRKAAGERG